MGCWCLLQSVARGVQQVLVCWKGEPISAATWEDLDDFIAKYSSFQLAAALAGAGGGGDVMWGLPYTRRRCARDVRRVAEHAASWSSVQEGNQEHIIG
jgi:hypothetical protein